MPQVDHRRGATLGAASLVITTAAILVLSGVTGPGLPGMSPSAVSIPAGDVDGWRQVFSDDFSGTAIDSAKWGRYEGEPGSDPGALWAPSRVSVAEGHLTLTTAVDDNGEWTSGGVNNARAYSPRAGRVEVRMRADHAPGVNVVALLWPRDNEWPPEIDFVEDRDGDREDFTASLHYSVDGKHRQIDERRSLDMTQWHTYGVEWQGDTVIYTVDGREWARTRSDWVPSVPMGVAIQSNVVTKGRVRLGPDTPKHSEVHVDWVVGYVPD